MFDAKHYRLLTSQETETFERVAQEFPDLHVTFDQDVTQHYARHVTIRIPDCHSIIASARIFHHQFIATDLADLNAAAVSFRELLHQLDLKHGKTQLFLAEARATVAQWAQKYYSYSRLRDESAERFLFDVDNETNEAVLTPTSSVLSNEEIDALTHRLPLYRAPCVLVFLQRVA
jgi:hypothetical protein